MKTHNRAPTIDELLVEHRKSHGTVPTGELLEFHTDLPNSGIYNPFAPFEHNGQLRIPVRVDPPASEDGSTHFFQRNGSPVSWDHDTGLPELPWQDPFHAQIGDKWYFGGVRTYKDSSGRIYDWDTQIVEVADPDELNLLPEPVITGPMRMKGLRPLGLDDELAGMITRPIDDRFPRGKVGYLALRNASEATPEALADAPIVDGYIAHEIGEWGGLGQPKDIGNRTFLATGHLARFSPDNGREYYGTLVLAQERGKKLAVIAQKIVACRQCFPTTPAKRVDLHNVFYMTGEYENFAYGGLSDFGSGRISIAEDIEEMRQLAA